MLNKYKITWVEMKADKGIVTKADHNKVQFSSKSHRQFAYFAFGSRENAMKAIESARGKLSKGYTFTLFTDAQFGAVSQEDKTGKLNVEFTKKQLEEVITLK